MNVPITPDAYPDLLNVLKTIDVFSTLDDEHLHDLIQELEHHTLQPGEVLGRQGEQSDRLYILITGCLEVIQESTGGAEELRAVIHPGQCIGEVSLITGEIRANTIRAREASALVSLSRASLNRIASNSPAIEALIIANIHHSFYTGQLNKLLEESDYFGSLEPAVLRDLKAEFSFETIKGGEHLMHQGDPSDSLYLIISGRVGVYLVDASGEKKLLIELGRGQTVGEMGLITHEPRSADVYALRDTLVARLSIESFERLLNKYPKDIMEHYAGASIKRLTSQIQGKPASRKVAISIALLPAQPDIPVKLFASRMAQALQAIGSTILITSQYCEEQLSVEGIAQASAEDPANSRLVLWLSEQEAEYKYVIYAGDPVHSQWTERCLRQADHILLLSMQPNLSILPDLTRASAYLVLLYGDDASHPTGTRAALARHHLSEHFKVHLNRSSDYARLARLLTGNGIGVVLSGGGARAIGQIGVLRALIEAGFEFDAFCGVSAGAVNAALFAMGLTPQESLSRWLAAARPVDYTFPFHSLVSGKNWTAGMQELMGDWQIEDLWLDYFCISANLTRSNLVVHRSGSLFQAVRASSSGPGILPPVYYDGDVLVDGGLINNFPANIMRADPRIGYIIGIDVSEVHERFSMPPFSYSVSGWRSLLARFVPFLEKPKIPNILEILSESMTISKSQSETSNRSLVDFYLVPPVQGFNLMDFDKMAAIVEVGYQYGRKVVAERQAE
jgi:NTE family protein